ncbi:unnamed protein product [Soboliphyme baturini]|uniref:BTB domain-containing protein n=1 Tax=Soboliphyme baturini TaxID=241478 RepID=A0A183IZ91_9BILA|nr:unnamed protein product [Soboliphyme baturini]
MNDHEELKCTWDDKADETVFVEELQATIGFHRFEEIRRRGKLCDVTLEVCGRRISAHRLVLAAIIPYFDGMFLNQMSENFSREITIKDANPDAFDALVSFAYTGRLKISTTNVQALFVTSSFLQMTSVFSACSDFLANRICLSNVLTLRDLGKSFACQKLVDACDRYINTHFSQVSNLTEFLSLPLEEVLFMLSRDQLFVKHEETVYCAGIRWVSLHE